MREVYAEKALSQIPRLLTMLDRNPYSPTYGCFFREYWHEKISDFPSGLFQYAVYSLALVYKHEMPGNIYHGNANVKRWILAALDYAITIQHRDGSYDEFYPNERGRAVTALLLYTFSATVRELRDELSPAELQRFKALCDRCAAFVCDFPKQEFGLLANHFTMIMCGLIYHHDTFGDDVSLAAYERYRDEYLAICDEEGWSLEYDGPDMGYLTATVSFIAKLWQLRPDPLLRDAVGAAVRYCALFVYPNGSYAGSVGSRQTLHFYSAGFEFFGAEDPLAQACAERMLTALSAGKLVPPEVMSDRYTYYRTEEFLLSYLYYSPRGQVLPPLPCDGEDFSHYYANSRVFVRKQGPWYMTANFLKGGIVKLFCGDELVCNDTGVHLRMADGNSFSSQWIDRDYDVAVDAASGQCRISGAMKRIPSQLFTPFTMAGFKLFVSWLGNSRRMADLIKKNIRRVLIVSARKTSDIRFSRTVEWRDDRIVVGARIECPKGSDVAAGGVGGEIHHRYVPQSRYFQHQDLDIELHELDGAALAQLAAGEPVTIEREFPLARG